MSDDGARLLLVDDNGTEFTLEITPALRTAIGGPITQGAASGPRLGHMERQMDSAPRPRDIQARIRAGESPEAVASAASTSLEKIMVYAGPVLAEREHLARRAQGASVRRATGDGGHARTLGESVEARMHALDVDPEGVEWDAWRREDGRWSLLAAYVAGDRHGTGTFTFDAPGNYVVLEDDDARWLVGEIPVTPASSAQPDDLEQVRSRRLAAVSPDQLPLGDDAIEMVGATEAEPEPEEPVAKPRALSLELSPELHPEQRPDSAPTLDEFLPGSEPATEPEPAPETADPEPDAEQEGEPEQEPPARRAVQKKKGRASVPSWDEIMFGGGDT